MTLLGWLLGLVGLVLVVAIGIGLVALALPPRKRDQ